MSDAVSYNAANAADIVAAIELVLPDKQRPVQLHEPFFGGKEWEYLKQCLDTGWVSSVGSFVDAFEKKLAELCDTKAAVATVNGTSALHVALHLLGVGPGDEVIVPALTFVATANAIAYCGADPHFVDSEESSLGIDPKKLALYLRRIAVMRDGIAVNRETGRPIRAVVPVHVFGHPADMAALSEACEPFALSIIEDATESLGSTYRGHPCGGLGVIGVLSFNGNKIVTTGGGGAIVTNDQTLAHRAKQLTTTARVPHKWAFTHNEIGWNYRLPNLNAALGLAQLGQLDGFVAAKRRLARRYADAFANVRAVKFVTEPEGSVSNYWLNAILLNEDSEAARDSVLEATHSAGFQTRPAWTLMHCLPMFRDSPRGDLSVAESIQRRLINLPSSAVLGMQ